MDASVFVKHRQRVLEQMEDNSFLVSISRRGEEKEVEAKGDVNRNYYYLSGVIEFDNIVVLTKINGTTTEMMFINPYDEFKAKWVGAPKSKEEVNAISGIKDIRYLSSYNQVIERLLSVVTNVYIDFIPNSIDSVLTEDEAFAKKISLKYPWVQIKNARNLFMKARTIKEPEEIEEMKKAIAITNKGIQAILSNIKECYEYQLESYFDQAIKYYGATGYAFTTIAASGKNATCLHYSDNNCLAKNGDLILFDLGASLNMYCADISRTFPVSGKFSPRQKQIYNIVLKGQELVFKSIKPGITTRELNQILINYYAVELKKIGLIQEDSEVSKYYYHGVSHHIGINVHDLCEYTPLKPGCVISNEPGLYILEEGIGIRIEDDVLVTENGAEWLSPQIIKTVEDIEEFIENRRN
ncbi:MAG: Xaa-Pro aminopeptidase [Anaeroplasma sp.]|nr:Xaa-Pro aminopeptidase [Anaeroplasma sp.]